MDQLSLFSPRVWSVGELNRRVRALLESDEEGQDIWVAGEISGLSRPASGHLYFTLKDSLASVRCVMWRESVPRTGVPVEGMAVEVHGRISLYEAGGQYQLYADRFRVAGEGELFARFVRLKEKLEREGLFAADRKQAIPTAPRRIAVVTSPTGAAWKDVQNVLRRRYPMAEVLLAPTAVQGEAAPDQIVSALRTADRADAGVILLVRGGGSIEDLWAFNDEAVVRAVAACATPLVTGVGHETDFTLSDFAADLRAPTPSAAAEMVSPDREEWRRGLSMARRRLGEAGRQFLEEGREDLAASILRLQVSSPAARLQNVRQQTDDLARRAETAVRAAWILARSRLDGAVRLLAGVSPDSILARGYALAWREEDGILARSVRQTPPGTPLRIQLSDGFVRARVDSAQSSVGSRAADTRYNSGEETP